LYIVLNVICLASIHFIFSLRMHFTVRWNDLFVLALSIMYFSLATSHWTMMRKTITAYSSISPHCSRSIREMVTWVSSPIVWRGRTHIGDTASTLVPNCRMFCRCIPLSKMLRRFLCCC